MSDVKDGEKKPLSRAQQVALRGEKAGPRKRPDKNAHVIRRLNPTFKCNIKAIRTKVGISQSATIRELGISFPSWKNIEAGCNVSLNTAIRVSKFFGVPIEEIWEPLKPIEWGSDDDEGQETEEEVQE